MDQSKTGNTLLDRNKEDSAFDISRRVLLNEDLSLLCEAKGGRFIDRQTLEIRYFNKTHDIRLPGAMFTPDVSFIEKILVLHYLTGKPCAPSRGVFVSYKNLPGGMFYYPTFKKRGPEKILSAFGDDPQTLVEASKTFGGERAGYGDISVRLTVFPKVEVLVVLNAKDEEFPPEVSILFQDDISNHLTLEDVAFLGDIIAKKLIGANKNAGNG